MLSHRFLGSWCALDGSFHEASEVGIVIEPFYRNMQKRYTRVVKHAVMTSALVPKL